MKTIVVIPTYNEAAALPSILDRILEGAPGFDVLVVDDASPDGTAFRQVAEIFSQQRIISDKNLFLFIGRVSRIDRKIRAGFYSVYRSMNLLDLLKVLRNGQIIEYEITIIEGDSLREVAAKLSEKNIIQEEEFLQISSDRSFLALYGIQSPSLEGYLYPDTYRIPKGMDPKEAVGMMINKLREQYSEKLRERSAEIGMSEREVLTLASIIEKEAARDDERQLISAVYHNSLRKNDGFREPCDSGRLLHDRV